VVFRSRMYVVLVMNVYLVVHMRNTKQSSLEVIAVFAWGEGGKKTCDVRSAMGLLSTHRTFITSSADLSRLKPFKLLR
jgi:hypothetical protein